MQSSPSPSLLKPDCALFATVDVVEDHAPAAPPAEHPLDSDHDFEIATVHQLDLLLPLSTNHEGSHITKYHISCISAFLEQTSCYLLPIHGLNLGRLGGDDVDHSLLDSFLAWPLHEDL